MIDLQVCTYLSSARFTARSGPSRLGRIGAWWRKRMSRPVVLRRVAPRPCDGDGAAFRRSGLDRIEDGIATAALSRRGGLMNVYVASAIDVALEAEALADGSPSRQVRTPIDDLVAEVVGDIQPCMAGAGVRLAYDPPGWTCVTVVDPIRLRKAVSHLVLRAASRLPHGGAVRIAVNTGPTDTRIEVLALKGTLEADMFDLTALERMLRAVGCALVMEPPRAGCTPLSIVLPIGTAQMATSPIDGPGR